MQHPPDEIDMDTGATASPKMSRRSFTTLAAGAAGAAVIGGFAVLQGTGAGPQAVGTFDVAHAPSVYVTMTNGAEFVVQVKRPGTGEVLESHTGVTAYNLLALQSDHVSFSKVA